MALALILLLASIAGCYQSHGPPGPEVDAAIVGDAVVGTGDGGRICGCPGSPTAQVCVLPRMCCPVTRTCEDPAHFNCSGSSRPCE